MFEITGARPVRQVALGLLATLMLAPTTTALGLESGDSRSPRVAQKAPPRLEVTVVPGMVNPGDRVELQVVESVVGRRQLSISDDAGGQWVAAADDGSTARFVLAEAGAQSGQVTVRMVRSRDGAVVSSVVRYEVRQPAWPGQVPGKVVVGMSCGSICAQRERELGRSYGVHRTFFGWGDWAGMAATIRADHAAGRLPWVSFKPPAGGAAGWQRVVSGGVDAGLRDLATMLKANDDRPVLVTFHHEPSNDGAEADGATWAAAYAHIHDLLLAQGALVNVSDPPIVGDWLFNAANRAQDPANWVTEAVLSRAPFLGLDLYENNGGETFAERIPAVRSWLAARGHGDLMVGIGETGGTDATYPKLSAVDWLEQNLGWAVDHPDEVAVLSYFNSTANSRDGVYWPLDESSGKLAAYRGWFNHAKVVTKLPNWS